MSITFTILGCGSSGGVPRVGNDWGDCDPLNPKNRRRRCSVLVEQKGPDGSTIALIDTGPDMREQLLDAGVGHLDAVLYTHAHADHLHGIDDLRAFWVKTKQRVPVYMDDVTYERASEAFSYCFRTPAGSNYPPILDRHPMQAGSPVSVTGAGGTLVFLPFLVAHGDIDALGFRIADTAYVPDVSDIYDESVKFLENLDFLVLDCLRHNPHPSHFHLEKSLTWTRKLNPKKAIFTNLHNDLDYETLGRDLPDSVYPAYDGLQLMLTETPETFALSEHAG
ncbi:MBL fold metallo-hydrolase [Rhodobacterales bacterium]|nr:MBL fold metallo-hydrolase [Rhodobacterales bacterium]